jgi:hypothetical protein
MPWPVSFFVAGLVFAFGFWLGQRFALQEVRQAQAADAGRSLSDRELMHLESIAVESLQLAGSAPAAGLTLSSPARSRAKSA